MFFVQPWLPAALHDRPPQQGCTVWAPQHYMTNLVVNSTKTAKITGKYKICQGNDPWIELPNSFRNGKKISTAAAVVVSWPRKQCDFISVTMVVPWYYQQMIWRNGNNDICLKHVDWCYWNLISIVHYKQGGSTSMYRVLVLMIWI